MSTLQNFPIVSQLSQITSDGRPSEDAPYECVAASIGAAILWYQGKTQWDSAINPDKLKDAAYGEAWRNNGTDATYYVEFCKSIGFHLYSVQGNPGHLVDLAHQYLAQGKPVIFTEPSPYASGWSHVCVFYQDGPGYLVALDPYIARSIHRTDADWLSLLLGNEIWIVERLEDNMKIDIHSPLVGNYFTLQPNGWWLSLHTKTSSGQPIYIRGEMLVFYCANNGLTEQGLPVSNEIPLDARGNTKQYFERGVTFFDPEHMYDNPPGAGRVYKAHLYYGPGQDPKIAEMQTQIDQLKQQPAMPQLFADMQQVKSIAQKY